LRSRDKKILFEAKKLTSTSAQLTSATDIWVYAVVLASGMLAGLRYIDFGKEERETDIIVFKMFLFISVINIL
jgi:hypothetical protein